MGRLSNLATRFREALAADAAHQAQARAELLGELEAFARQAGVFEVKATKKALTIGFRGSKLSFKPDKEPSRLDVAYPNSGEGEHVGLDGEVWRWSRAPDRDLLEGGLEQLLHVAIGVPIEVPEPEPEPEPEPAPRGRVAKEPTLAPPTGDSDNVQWVLAEIVRADLVCYTGRNCSGRVQYVQVFPGEHRKGKLDGATFQSVIVAGPIGTRVVLATGLGDAWEDYPWRAIVITEDNSFVAPNGKHAVRIPDLDVMSRPDARYAPEGIGESYALADALADGRGWTFGRVGSTPIKNRVRTIIIDKA